jgi:hypothetical protein
MNLFHLFSGIPCASSSTNFTAIPLSLKRRDFLAKGADGSPVFLLHDASTAHYSPGLQFKYLTAQFHATCRVQTNGNNLQDQFALVCCDSNAPELYEIFIRCFGAVIEELPVACSTKELNSCIQSIVDLFKVLSQPSGREVSGLWAELYVMSVSCNISHALATWHRDPFDRFDFSWGGGCLEIKSSVKPTRSHEFALEQLVVPTDGVGYVASLLLQPLSSGLSVLDLANTIATGVTNSALLKQKLWKNIARVLGSEFSEKLDKRFDASYAERHLALYAMDDVPKPEHPIDPRITSIRFLADLTGVKSSLKKSSTRALRDIFLVP